LLWNDLPESLRTCSSLQSFKNKIKILYLQHDIAPS
jgi:hypothetical protein